VSYRKKTMTTESCPPEPTVTPPADADLEIAVVAKALGNPVRVRILRLLLARETCYCGQIVEELPLAQATVSQHLKILKEAGLVRGEIEGPRVCYCANRERLRQLEGLVGELADTVAPILEGVA
jgi:DNA-binding transcriptional ArsR family regulator